MGPICVDPIANEQKIGANIWRGSTQRKTQSRGVTLEVFHQAPDARARHYHRESAALVELRSGRSKLEGSICRAPDSPPRTRYRRVDDTWRCN
jgi:hypothetical protein